MARKRAADPKVIHQFSPPLGEAEAARLVGMSLGHMRSARRDGTGPVHLRIGRAVRYRLTDLNLWLRARAVRPRPRPRSTSANRRVQAAKE